MPATTAPRKVATKKTMRSMVQLALCRDNAEFGQVGPQRIDGLCALRDEQISHAVLRLLVGGLHNGSAKKTKLIR